MTTFFQNYPVLRICLKAGISNGHYSPIQKYLFWKQPLQRGCFFLQIPHGSIDEKSVHEKESQALVEQLTIVDKSVLMDKKGSLPKDIINEIESAIRIQFGFAA